MPSQASNKKLKKLFFQSVIVLEWFGKRFQKFFLLLLVVQRNSTCFYLLRYGSKRNSELFIVRRMTGTEFRAFSVPRKRRNSNGMNKNFRLFRLPRNNFSRKMATIIAHERERELQNISTFALLLLKGRVGKFFNLCFTDRLPSDS
jgi:hypothetical protein